ncbi:uncharacterized protein EI90DRAFT_3092626 [Cantharellus anzutake]|uniref:uncharacterized protein n=1 Tax=Cantharellus anzutake TaxID=1750568 RepID=UPI00190326A7|nr:uncharacterized protein EI90DRAFT_3092626 [Cantharellus anzutake]KAF8313013.1 hypothetical protein EI90DRAFT_3092626 [Cantharellus anzutake]
MNQTLTLPPERPRSRSVSPGRTSHSPDPPAVPSTPKKRKRIFSPDNSPNSSPATPRVAYRTHTNISWDAEDATPSERHQRYIKTVDHLLDNIVSHAHKYQDITDEYKKEGLPSATKTKLATLLTDLNITPALNRDPESQKALADAIAIAKQLTDTNASLVKQLETVRTTTPTPAPTQIATATSPENYPLDNQQEFLMDIASTQPNHQGHMHR